MNGKGIQADARKAGMLQAQWIPSLEYMPGVNRRGSLLRKETSELSWQLRRKQRRWITMM
jgi:hypothetical protein